MNTWHDPTDFVPLGRECVISDGRGHLIQRAGHRCVSVYIGPRPGWRGADRALAAHGYSLFVLAE